MGEDGRGVRSRRACGGVWWACAVWWREQRGCGRLAKLDRHGQGGGEREALARARSVGKWGPGGQSRARAVALRWCSAWPSAPWRGGGAGLCGRCQGLRLRAHGRPSPRRGGASVGLAREGGPAGRTRAGAGFDRGTLRRGIGQGRAAHLSGRLGSAVAQLRLQRGAPSGEALLSLALAWREGAGGVSRVGGGRAPQRKPGRPLQGGRA